MRTVQRYKTSEISRCDLSINATCSWIRVRYVNAVKSLAQLLTTTAKMQMNPLPLHELLQVLAWLEGIWITDEPGTVSYPTMKDFNYYDQINITSTGQPLLNYVAQSWHPDNGMPLHRETGFLQILPGTKKVVLSLIDNIGLFTVEQGDLVNDDSGTIELKSTNVLTTDASIPTFPTLTETRRVYKRDGDNLELVFYMATSKTTELTEHLRAKYRKVQ